MSLGIVFSKAMYHGFKLKESNFRLPNHEVSPDLGVPPFFFLLSIGKYIMFNVHTKKKKY